MNIVPFKRFFWIVSFGVLLTSPEIRAQTTDKYGLSSPVKVDVIRKSAALALEVEFIDPNNNSVLDADETAQVVLTVTNLGPGKAYRVNLRARPVDVLPGVRGELDHDIGTLLPKQQVTERFEIHADLNVQSGMAAYLITAMDVYRTVISTPKRLEIEVLRFESPNLQIVGVTIDDDQEGGTFGNNNRIVEMDERIECTIRLQNKGFGKALDVKAAVGAQQGLFFSGRTFNIGDLDPQKWNDISFFFSVPNNYDGSADLIFPVYLTESRSRFGLDTTITFTINKSDEQHLRLVDPETIAFTGLRKGRAVVVDAPSLIPDVDENIPQGRIKRPNAVALVIGIKRYDSGVPNAEFADNDARIVRDYFINTLGIDRRYILPHDPNVNITSGKLKRLVKYQLPQYVKQDKTELFVYFSGHGAPDPNTGEVYLIPSDCDPNYLDRESAYLVEDFYTDLGRLNPKQLVVVIEACYSGQSGSGDYLLQEISPGSIRLKMPKFALKNGVLFNSSAKGQVSYWHPDNQHGLFTYFFLKGLRGDADFNNDRQITVDELGDYLLENVQEESLLQRQYPQTPVILGDPSIVLVRY